jgi:restriction system protein
VPIPNYQKILLPLLKLLADQKIYHFKDLVNILASEFKLSPAELNELLPSGTQPLFRNRVGWAKTYLKKAALVGQEKRGTIKITDRGISLLKENPPELSIDSLRRYPEFRSFITKPKRESLKPGDEDESSSAENETPEEQLEYAHQELKRELADELLKNIKECSPEFFEKLVVDLLIKMGYGGSRKDAGEAVGRTGDGGIDAIIKEDRLGLDKIYIQAKRWAKTIPIGEVRDFSGALDEKKSRKGVFITTSTFPQSAYSYVGKIEKKIILIDGEKLAELMIEYNVGISTQKVLEIKQIDSDYFQDY